MNTIILSVFASLALIPLVVSFGMAQTDPAGIILAFVQTTVRNSDGTLVVYLESTKFAEFHLSLVESFLEREANQNDPTIVIDGQKYQIIRRVQSQPFDSHGLVAGAILYDDVDGKMVTLARFTHDGYTTAPGDTLESVWTFVRHVS